MARETGAPPFSAADVTFAEAAAPIIAGVVDRAPSDDAYDAAVPEVQLVLTAERKPASMSFGVVEMLRDISGGGAGAVEATLGRIEKAAAAVERATRSTRRIIGRARLIGWETPPRGPPPP